MLSSFADSWVSTPRASLRVVTQSTYQDRTARAFRNYDAIENQRVTVTVQPFAVALGVGEFLGQTVVKNVKFSSLELQRLELGERLHILKGNAEKNISELDAARL